MSTQSFDVLAQKLSALGVVVERQKSLALLTTYGVGGPAEVAVTVRTEAEIESVASVLSQHSEVEVVVLGRGSNTLIADRGFSGVVVIIGTSEESRNIQRVAEGVRVSASMLMPVLARRTVQQGLGGLEWCVGIPGTVGGAIRMNAGGHGADIADSLISANVVSLHSGHTRTVDVKDMGLHFRGSAVSAHHVVTAATFAVSDISIEDGTRTLDDIVSWRRSHQPGGRNAGSVFVNPAPDEGSAGSLIDQCGLRGFTVGGAQVSEKHANFIQASDGATANDVVSVMTHVQQVVESRHGIVLRSEVRLVGFDAEVSSRFSDKSHNDNEIVTARQHLCELLGERNG
ncbi:MAG: UDP-N-acetylenolpyruvoylglucosamine reductase [Actinomycetota bacterium]|jgi:UDP-N-acetylmuramate dehydrogenase